MEIESDKETYEDRILICMLINIILDFTFLVCLKYFAVCFEGSHLSPHSRFPVPVEDSHCYSSATKSLQKKKKKP